MTKIKELYYKIIYKTGRMQKLYYIKDEWLGGCDEYLRYKGKYYNICPNYDKNGKAIRIKEIRKEEVPKYSIERDFFENVYYYDIDGNEIVDKRIISGFNEENDEAYKLKQRMVNI